MLYVQRLTAFLFAQAHTRRAIKFQDEHQSKPQWTGGLNIKQSTASLQGTLPHYSRPLLISMMSLLHALQSGGVIVLNMYAAYSC